MIVHRNFLLVLLLPFVFFSGEVWAQSSLREAYQAQQQPKEIQYPDGFEVAVGDFSSTWDAIIEQGDYYLIMRQLPNNKPGGRGIYYGKNIKHVIGVFVVGERVFEPVYTNIRNGAELPFIWKGQTFECAQSCRDCYVRPELLGVTADDGFVQFQSRYLLYESDIRKGDWGLELFEVNFDSRECFVQGQSGDVRRCHLVSFKDYSAASLGEPLYRFNSKRRQIQSTKQLKEACRLPN